MGCNVTKEQETLVLENIKLIHLYANKMAWSFYSPRLRNYGFVHQIAAELAAFGKIGLVKAAIDFDQSRGVKFSTFACLYIRRSIQDEVDHVIPRIGPKIRSQLGMNSHRKRIGKDTLKISPNLIYSISAGSKDDEIIGVDYPIRDTSISERESEDRVKEHEDSLGYVNDLLAKIMDARWAEVVYRHVVLDESLKTIAKKFKVTKQRIFQMHQSGMKVLRRKGELQLHLMEIAKGYRDRERLENETFFATKIA